jgi:hypothetical protein
MILRISAARLVFLPMVLVLCALGFFPVHPAGAGTEHPSSEAYYGFTPAGSVSDGERFKTAVAAYRMALEAAPVAPRNTSKCHAARNAVLSFLAAQLNLNANEERMMLIIGAHRRVTVGFLTVTQRECEARGSPTHHRSVNRSIASAMRALDGLGYIGAISEQKLQEISYLLAQMFDVPHSARRQVWQHTERNGEGERSKRQAAR